MEDILNEIALQLKLELPETAAPAFRRYREFLEEKNKVMNLTGITGETEVYTLHFADSLALFGEYDFSGKKVIDVGTGAGFPGLPIKIAEPTVSLTLLDAQQKRINFLSELCENAGIRGVECLHARAEEAAFIKEMREQYDAAVSRAVARLNVLCELTMPFVKPGGVFIAMKGTDSDEEIREAEPAITKLGGRIGKIADYTVACTDIRHRLVIIEKTGNTPSGYPRRFAKIQKSPIK